MEDWVPLGSREYLALLGALVFGRGLDMLSTRLATPGLLLEANPIVKAMGWKWSVLVNLVMCGLLAVWPVPAVVVATTSILVGARNFQFAWQMRTLGEELYRQWHSQLLQQAPPGLFALSLTGHVLGFFALGTGLVLVSADTLPAAIGYGFITYAVTVLFFSSLAMRRHRTVIRID